MPRKIEILIERYLREAPRSITGKGKRDWEWFSLQPRDLICLCSELKRAREALDKISKETEDWGCGAVFPTNAAKMAREALGLAKEK